MGFNLSQITFFFSIVFLFSSFIPFVKHATANNTENDTISRSTFRFEKQFSDEQAFLVDSLSFPDSFDQIEGVSTFRGGPYRDRPFYKDIDTIPKYLEVKWSYSTGLDTKWGGGAGWTGQPCIIKWSDTVRNSMNVLPKFKMDSSFKEVILGSLDGKIYFLDLKTGEASRPAINIKNPIKGSVSVDSRGWPILFAGQGISNTGEFGVRIFNLLDQSRIFYLNGKDAFAYRSWSAFDSSPLILGDADNMFIGGENGLVYKVKLNSNYKFGSQSLSIEPEVMKQRYLYNSTLYQGIESSLVGYHDRIFFSDNHGFIHCRSAINLDPIWVLRNHDDTDATLVLSEENENPFLYTGSEVDLQGAKGFTYIKKINAIDGSTLWETKFACLTVLGDHPVNGGMLSTPVIGKRGGDSLVVFSISRYGGMNKGLLTALKKSNGEKVWEVQLDNYAWSSPLDIYDRAGNMYIFLADSKGFVMLFNGLNGGLIYKSKIAELFEASPAAFGNMIVIASRPRKIFCLEVK